MLHPIKSKNKRSGMILLIVVAFLAMFMVVGTTYLMVADSIRRTSEFDLNATDKRSDFALMPDIDPRYIFNIALGQIVYDVADPLIVGGKVVTTNSALRGHSLARDIYGGYIAGGTNDRPFQGSGKTAAESGQANYIVNIPSGSTVPVPAIVNPEKGTIPSRWNPPYTYADPNHLFLGSYSLDVNGIPTISPSFNNPAMDATGGLGLDVKNLEGYPGVPGAPFNGNDSIWIDAGFPVMTTPDGRKYKTLIAPLILDLDGRINLNVAGNLMQRDGSNPYFADHASNQGWGRWEINPKKLIDFNPYPGQPQNSPLTPANEFLNLLSYGTTSGNPATTFPPPMPPPPPPPNPALNQWKTYGRLFQDKYMPINAYLPPITTFASTLPHSYAAVDFNGAGDYQAMGGWGPTTKPNFINANGFPTFGNGFGNGQAVEHFLDGPMTAALPYHARNFNPYRTQSSANGVSTVFPISETASILRWQGKGEPFSKSQLGQLLPKSLGLDMPYENAGAGSSMDGIFRQRIRNMVTTHSADLDRPAMVPIAIDAGYAVIANNNQPNNYPLRSAVDSVVPTPNSTTPPLKLDLDRKLRNFPPYNSVSGLFYDNSIMAWGTTSAAIINAIDDREAFARDIFNYLKNITGFTGSDNTILIIQQTNRWLAQLAVNIVDFIDNDDFNTRWEWTPGQWVFGVEMPRLVINEVYVQCQNNKNDMLTNDTAIDPYDINTFIELYNPLIEDANYGINPGTHKAVLQYAISPTIDASNYKLVIAKRGRTRTNPTMFSDNIAAKITEIDSISNPKKVNYHGAFDFTSPMDTPPTLPLDTAEVTTWQTGDQIVDVDTCKLLRDSADLRLPATPAFNGLFNFKNASLNMTVPVADMPGLNEAPAVFLQRLTMPGLPFENNPANKLYNPYITTDSFTAKNMHDYRERDANKIQGAMIINPIVESASRLSPFLDSSGNSFYNGANAQPAQAPTFGNKNNNNNLPWFTFLDRQLIHPLELIHVPCCKPHELTQMATRWNDSVAPAGVTTFSFAATWPWFDENTRLYRFLEAVGVSPLQAGEAMHGRVLGKVNVNTMASDEVFQAVADAAVANNFTAADVKNGYENLIGIPGDVTKPDHRPILSFGQANYTDGMGVKNGLNKTLMGYSDANTPYINFLDVLAFNATGPNVATYARKELLTKIGNSVTTRSNVFAIWITTGYFEVTNDTTQPPTLGAEMGKADGINIRHRMFAIVDRTHITSFETTYPNAIIVTPPATSVTVPYAGAVTGINPNTRANWTIIPGTILVFEPNTDFEETVEVQVGGNINFTKNHSANCRVINRGNPGPWIGYDRMKDKDVVIYSEIIE